MVLYDEVYDSIMIGLCQYTVYIYIFWVILYTSTDVVHSTGNHGCQILRPKSTWVSSILKHKIKDKQMGEVGHVKQTSSIKLAYSLTMFEISIICGFQYLAFNIWLISLYFIGYIWLISLTIQYLAQITVMGCALWLDPMGLWIVKYQSIVYRRTYSTSH